MIPVEIISIIAALSILCLIVGIDFQIKKNKKKTAAQIRVAKFKRDDDDIDEFMAQMNEDKDDESLFQNIADFFEATILNINGGINFFDKIEERLTLAGNPRGWKAREYIAFYILFAGTILILGGLMVQVNYLSPLMYIIALTGGFLYPYGWLQSRITERQEAVFSELPNFLDQILLNLSEEQSILDKAIKEVTSPDNLLEHEQQRILIKEFRRAYLEQSSQKSDPDVAYLAAADRINVPEVYDLVDVFNQWYVNGSPITNILEEMSEHIYSVFEQQIAALIKKKDMQFTLSTILFAVSTCILIAAPIVSTAAQALGGLT